MKELIKRHLNGKKVLLFFVVTNLVYAAMLLITIPQTMAFSNGMKLLDMMPGGYDLNYIRLLLSTLGKEGREIYLYRQIALDMIYPFLFSVSYSLLIGYFLNRLKRLNRPYIYLCALPFLAGIADYLENFGITAMLLLYPEIPNVLGMSTNIFSLIKSSATTVYFIALLLTLIFLGIQKINMNKSAIQ